jgi:uncharacterized membrane protein
VSAALATLGWLGAWSGFTGLVNYALVTLLFLGEWRYRRWRFPHYRHFSLLEMRQYLRCWRRLREAPAADD